MVQLAANKITVCGPAYIPKHVLKSRDVEKIYEDLKIESKYGGDPVYAYEEIRQADTLVVPRHWFARHLSRDYKHLIVNRDPKPKVRHGWTFNGKLRAHQKSPKPGFTATPELAKILESRLGFYAEGPCGSGKTVSAIYTIAQMGVRTIVVTPSEQIRQQWIDALHRFLPEARVTVYGGPKAKKRRDLTGDVVVASLHLLSQLTENLEGFPLYIMDEAHIAAAPVFQKAMFRVPYRWSLALSATGDRFDGMDKLFRYSLGTHTRQLDTDQMPVTCVFKPIEYDAIEKKRLERKSRMTIDRELAVDERRNIKLVQAIDAAYKKGRKIMVLGKDLLQLRILREVLLKVSPDTKTALVGGEISRSGKKLPEFARTAAEREIDERNMNDPEAVVFSTFKLLGTGTDMPEKDALVFASNLLDPRQALGRIQRKFPGKPLPIALFIADNLKQITRRYKGMYYGAMKPLGKDRCRVINECPYLREALKGTNIKHTA